jgi:hypothetical protein
MSTTDGEYTEPIPETIMGTVAEAPTTSPAAEAAAVAHEPPPAAPAAAAEPAAPRPTDVVIVTLLALFAAIGDVIAGVAWLIERDSLPDGAAYLAWAALLIGLGTALLAIMLFTGSRIARTVIAVFMLFRIAMHIWAWISIGSDAAVGAMIEILIATVVLILLFSRESTAFLTGSKP